MSRIAFIGLGAMGSRMAANLLAAGHALTVHNRNAARAAPLFERGAALAASPRAAAEGAAFVISMVRDDEASRNVWLDPDIGAISAMGGEAIAIECSTVSVAYVGELEQFFSKAQRAFLAAPVLGSLPQAETKALIALAGGQARDRAQSILSAMAGRIMPVGSPSQAAALKLAINAMFSSQVALFAELLAALRIVGLDAAHVLAAIADLPTTSPALAGAAGLMVKGDDAPRYPTGLVEKDLRYLLQIAAGDTRIVTAAAEDYARAVNAGWGERNISGIARLFG